MTNLKEPEPGDGQEPATCPKCGITYRLTPGGLCWVCWKYAK